MYHVNMNASTLFYRSHLVLHIATNNTKKRYPSRTALYYSSCRLINITASTINNKEDLYPSVTNIKYHHHFFSTDNSTKEENKEEVESDATIAKESAQKFQQLMSSRRTVSNFVSYPKSTSQQQQPSDRDRMFLQNAIKRGVECAVTAPNHKITEPTTFHRILSPSAESERLLDIVYETTYQRLREKQLSGEGACRSEAMRKRGKWAKIPAFVIATVSGMEDHQTSSSNNAKEMYKEQPLVPPTTNEQLEDYASACASIQNLLLSLHAEDLGCKWATGPIIRTSAFRDLIGCEKNDMIVGLIMIGWTKRLPKMRRRREIEDDVLRDVLLSRETN